MLPKKFSLLLIFSIILTLGLSISLGSLLAAWTAPASTPPEGNIAAPINTSTTGQAKQGGLILNTGGSVNGLIVQFGNVGIGTTNPQAALDVAGNINASGNISSAAPTASNHLATKGYVDAVGGAGGEYVQGNAVYFTSGGNNYYCSQRSVSSSGVVTISNVNEGQPCDTNKVCNSGQCSSPGEFATACTTGSQCSSGYCVDGYCCDSACGGTCQACNVFGSSGICTSIPAGTDPASECSPVTCTNYIYGGTNPSCYKYASANSNNGMCNGAGACYTSSADSCTGQGGATITCGSTGCWKACAADALATSFDNYSEVCYTSGTQNCTGGLVCDATGACKSGAGVACTADSQCGSGYLCGVDSDGDRYLTSATTGTCILGTAHTDCCDSDSGVHPGAGIRSTASACGGWDLDCNGSVQKDSSCKTCTACSLCGTSRSASSIGQSCVSCTGASTVYDGWSHTCGVLASCGQTFTQRGCRPKAVSCPTCYSDWQPWGCYPDGRDGCDVWGPTFGIYFWENNLCDVGTQTCGCN